MSRLKSDKVGNGSKCNSSVWLRAISANAEWPDKVNITLFFVKKFCYLILLIYLILFQEEFLDVIYWSRQVIGIIVGIAWGLIPLKGFLGLLL